MKRIFWELLIVLSAVGVSASGPALADFCSARCYCSASSGAYQCSFDAVVGAEDASSVARVCSHKTNSHGRIVGQISCQKEQNSEVGCSSELIPNGSNPISTSTQNGLYSFRVCSKLPPGKTAEKIYCQMYDHPNIFGCNNDYNTSNSCPYSAFAAMFVSTDNNNQKTYCWVHHSEDVKRPRDFSIYVKAK